MDFIVPISAIPDIKRTKERFDLSRKTDKDVFYDICFCLCAPQTKWRLNIEVQKKLREIDFYQKGCDQQELEEIVKSVRFFRVKAVHLLEAREDFPHILANVRSNKTSQAKRDWMVDSIRGCGMKVASHFLRNLGNEDLAIIDTHIINFMDMGKPTSRTDYEFFESEFRKIAEANKLSIMELDMYLWKVRSNTSWEEFVV
jgi:N-glycosylase/DNA lyase